MAKNPFVPMERFIRSRMKDEGIKASIELEQIGSYITLCIEDPNHELTAFHANRVMELTAKALLAEKLIAHVRPPTNLVYILDGVVVNWERA